MPTLSLTMSEQSASATERAVEQHPPAREPLPSIPLSQARVACSVLRRITGRQPGFGDADTSPRLRHAIETRGEPAARPGVGPVAQDCSSGSAAAPCRWTSTVERCVHPARGPAQGGVQGTACGGRVGVGHWLFPALSLLSLSCSLVEAEPGRTV